LGVPKDLNKAAEYFQRAKTLGHTSGDNALREVQEMMKPDADTL
jgi:TPR repeat protein